jgi:hypothetical protein
MERMTPGRKRSSGITDSLADKRLEVEPRLGSRTSVLGTAQAANKKRVLRRSSTGATGEVTARRKRSW